VVRFQDVRDLRHIGGRVYSDHLTRHHIGRLTAVLLYVIRRQRCIGRHKLHPAPAAPSLSADLGPAQEITLAKNSHEPTAINHWNRADPLLDHDPGHVRNRRVGPTVTTDRVIIAEASI
jgi:hypothetical protein